MFDIDAEMMREDDEDTEPVAEPSATVVPTAGASGSAQTSPMTEEEKTAMGQILRGVLRGAHSVKFACLVEKYNLNATVSASAAQVNHIKLLKMICHTVAQPMTLVALLGHS